MSFVYYELCSTSKSSEIQQTFIKGLFIDVIPVRIIVHDSNICGHKLYLSNSSLEVQANFNQCPLMSSGCRWEKSIK